MDEACTGEKLSIFPFVCASLNHFRLFVQVAAERSGRKMMEEECGASRARVRQLEEREEKLAVERVDVHRQVKELSSQLAVLTEQVLASQEESGIISRREGRARNVVQAANQVCVCVFLCRRQLREEF